MCQTRFFIVLQVFREFQGSAATLLQSQQLACKLDFLIMGVFLRLYRLSSFHFALQEKGSVIIRGVRIK